MPKTSTEPVEATEHPSTAVFFVHGMGSQKRFEDASKLVESLDQYTQDAKKGRLRRIEPDFERSNDPSPQPITFLTATWLPGSAQGGADDSTDVQGERFRFYEAYWAPIAADEVPRWQVASWMFTQLPKPLAALRTPWRHRSRLRRAALLSTEAVSGDDQKNLYQLYDQFESYPARRDYKDGSFGQFKEFVAASRPDESALIEAATKWHRGYRLRELANLLVLVTIAIAILAAAGFVLLTLVRMVALASGTGVADFDLGQTFGFARSHWQTISLLGGILLVVTPVARFLESYLGDVLMWTTYEETNSRYRKRKEILDLVSKCLRQVVENPKNQRVVVVAHSLGTAVAVDAILGLARDARSTDTGFDKNLRKITHLVTYGSPIDKIEYLFEETGLSDHRYNRVVEDLRGDIGTEPFAQNGKRYVHWVNLWDKADLIAGSLESQCNRHFPELRVNNVEVKGGRWPNPASAHTGYTNRKRVMEILFEVIFERTTGRCDGQHSPDRPFGPDDGWAHTRPLQILAALIVWGAFGLLVWSAFTSKLDLVAVITLGIAALVLLSLIVGSVRRFFA